MDQSRPGILNRPQLSLRTLLSITCFCCLALAFGINVRRMRTAEYELQQLRAEIGYLEASDTDQIAAVRVASEEPLVWQARVRIPKNKRYRVAYSAIWNAATNKPDWFAAQPVPEGESLVTVRVMKDPRDDQWRISTSIRHADGTGRIGTVLPDEISKVFRNSHSTLIGGVGKQTVLRPAIESIRLFEDRYISGTGLLLYGDRPPPTDVIGIFAELQPDIGTL